jgi:KEOPS complex subunit Cgi121
VSLWLEKFNKHLTYAGFNNVKIKDVNKLFQTLKHETDDACVQLLDASFVAGAEHLRFAALNALNAFEGQFNISSSLAIEILLYASAQRQIKRAMDMIGIKPGMSRVAVLVLAENEEKASAALETICGILSAERDDAVLDFTDEKTDGVKDFSTFLIWSLYPR